MTEKFEGIVLRTFKYSDSLMVADIYTKSRGRLSFLVPVSHSKRSKVRNVLFQPLSMLSFTASFKKGAMSRVQEVQPYNMLLSLQGDVVKSSQNFFHIRCARGVRTNRCSTSWTAHLHFSTILKPVTAISTLSLWCSCCVILEYIPILKDIPHGATLTCCMVV